MRFLLPFIFSFIFFCKGNAQTTPEISESDIYNFMNNAIFNEGKRVLLQDSLLNEKYTSWNCYNEDSVVIYAFDCVIKDMMLDTLHYFIDSQDVIFMKEQLSKNKIMVWEGKKLHKKVKVCHKKKLLAGAYALPLFSRDKKTVVIALGGPWGFQAFHFNSEKNSWERIDVIQTGT